jgi:hypothetical protein
VEMGPTAHLPLSSRRAVAVVGLLGDEKALTGCDSLWRECRHVYDPLIPPTSTAARPAPCLLPSAE